MAKKQNTGGWKKMKEKKWWDIWKFDKKLLKVFQFFPTEEINLV